MNQAANVPLHIGVEAPPPTNEKRQSYELCVLTEIARTLNASVDLPALLAQALEKVAELLGLETGWVLLLDEATGEPKLAAAQNLPPGLRDEPERMAGWCYCLESFFAGYLDHSTNVNVVGCSRLGRLAHEHGCTAGLKYHATVPLQVCIGETSATDIGDVHDPCKSFKRLGILNVATPEWRRLTKDELDLLRTIGDILSVGIERVRLHERRLEAAQAEERNRLAREIHDTIAQDFSAIAFQLEAAEALLDQQVEPARVRGRVAAALDLTRKGLEEARRSVLDLRAAPLEGRNLSDALAALAEEADRSRAPLTEQADRSRAPEVRFLSTGGGRSLPPAVEVGMYRIAQEALQNTLHHADAARVTLHLDVSAHGIRLIVDDDGRGFDTDAVSNGRAAGHFGLVGMRERARLLGGILSVESAPGVGTRISAEVRTGPTDVRATAEAAQSA